MAGRGVTHHSPAAHAALGTGSVSKPQHPTVHQVPGCCRRSCRGCSALAALKARWSHGGCFCPAAVAPRLPSQLRSFPVAFPLLPPWVEVLQHLLGLGLLFLCLFATGEGHGQEPVVQPGGRMPAEHGGTASPFPPCNEGDEHPQLHRGTKGREAPHPHGTAPTKASPPPPGPPQWGQRLLAPWHGLGSGPPKAGDTHLSHQSFIYTAAARMQLFAKPERNGTQSVPLSPGGTAGTGGGRGWVWRGRCLGLASLEHLLPALHARLLLDVLPPVTDITEVLLLGEG